MKLAQFISQHKGKFLEVVDPTNKNQCMDLSRAWFDNLGHGQANAHMNAYEVYTKATTETLKHFDKIPNTIDAVPQEGDIVVWAKEYNGTAGHIAIATGEGDTLSFQAFSQNDPTGSPCILKTYTYVYVLGWLRSKTYNQFNPDTTWPNKDKYDALIRSFSAFNDQGRTNYYSDDPSRLTADIIDREETIEEMRRDFRDKEQEISTHKTNLLKAKDLQKKAENDLKHLQDHPIKEYIKEEVMIEPKKKWIGYAIKALYELDHQLSKDK